MDKCGTVIENGWVSIENGKVKISEYYVHSLADVYGVEFESIVVFASGYDEGFYQGMQTKLKLTAIPV